MGGLQGNLLVMRQVIHHWIPSSQLGGIEMAALTLIQETPSHTHVVATGDAFGPAADLWRSAGAEVVPIPDWGGRLGVAWLGHWARFVRERRVNNLISWSPTRMSMMISPLEADTRCLVHLGNVGGLSRRARLQDGLARAILRPTCIPKLVACSHAVLESISGEPAYAGLSREMIYNPVRSQFLDIGVQRTMIQPRMTTWGMIARLALLKDHRTLIQSVALLSADLEFSLEIVGDGELEGELKAQVLAAGLQHRIRFLGATSAPQEALRRWDGFVFSTTEAEGFGIAVAEAMAAGLPCVLSDVRAMREVAGSCAFYAPAGNSSALAKRITAVAADPSSARLMGQAAHRRAASLYSPKAFARSYIEAIGLRIEP